MKLSIKIQGVLGIPSTKTGLFGRLKALEIIIF